MRVPASPSRLSAGAFLFEEFLEIEVAQIEDDESNDNTNYSAGNVLIGEEINISEVPHAAPKKYNCAADKECGKDVMSSLEPFYLLLVLFDAGVIIFA